MDEGIAGVLAGQLPYVFAQGDCLEVMRSMPDDSVSLIMSSPPYQDCRLYLENGEDLGIARDTEAWVSWMVAVCKEARRICTGLCCFVVEGKTTDYRYSCSPFLLMADLHRAGFHLRKPPIYKRVGIPGSGGPDWLRNDYEPCVVFSRGGKLPWSDNTACGTPPKWQPGGEMSYRRADGKRKNAVPAFGTDDCKSGSQERKKKRNGYATMAERNNVGPHRARQKKRGYLRTA